MARDKGGCEELARRVVEFYRSLPLTALTTGEPARESVTEPARPLTATERSDVIDGEGTQLVKGTCGHACSWRRSYGRPKAGRQSPTLSMSPTWSRVDSCPSRPPLQLTASSAIQTAMEFYILPRFLARFSSLWPSFGPRLPAARVRLRRHYTKPNGPTNLDCTPIEQNQAIIVNL